MLMASKRAEDANGAAEPAGPTTPSQPQSGTKPVRLPPPGPLAPRRREKPPRDPLLPTLLTRLRERAPTCARWPAPYRSGGGRLRWPRSRSPAATSSSPSAPVESRPHLTLPPWAAGTSRSRPRRPGRPRPAPSPTEPGPSRASRAAARTPHRSAAGTAASRSRCRPAGSRDQPTRAATCSRRPAVTPASSSGSSARKRSGSASSPTAGPRSSPCAFPPARRWSGSPRAGGRVARGRSRHRWR